jgi:hypothetical protein
MGVGDSEIQKGESNTDLEDDTRSSVGKKTADGKRCDYIIGDRRHCLAIETVAPPIQSLIPRPPSPISHLSFDRY